MKNTLRVLVLCLAVVMMLSVFAACAKKNSENAVTVTVKISAEGSVIFDDEVVVYSDEPTVMDAFRQAMDDDDEFPMVVFDNDEDPLHVKNIGDYVDSTEKFWEFRVNDIPFADIKGAAGAYLIKEGDVIYYEYGVVVEDTADATADDTAAE